MGFCIMFPHLCGLKNVKAAEMKQVVIDISDALENSLRETEDITERLALIEIAKERAIYRLKGKGYSIYEMV